MRLVKVHEVVAPIQVADVFTKSLLEEHWWWIGKTWMASHHLQTEW
jgi:hypothetical protein